MYAILVFYRSYFIHKFTGVCPVLLSLGVFIILPTFNGGCVHFGVWCLDVLLRDLDFACCKLLFLMIKSFCNLYMEKCAPKGRNGFLLIFTSAGFGSRGLAVFAARTMMLLVAYTRHQADCGSRSLFQPKLKRTHGFVNFQARWKTFYSFVVELLILFFYAIFANSRPCVVNSATSCVSVGADDTESALSSKLVCATAADYYTIVVFFCN
ncbi:hypothetical protein F2P56_034166 [Juglans regia]|uniref:Transmembrane protein n=2 Tax=Juglans regia TaxID=51240 RepID=A0A833WDP8_JUGRE|nr:uncharacterized protein LOC108991666 [Juglans regia]KAF5445086.1 hypothetical protein F2P56_034164 [Juglans regia]KAF5445087.1 hypothetical protein F2P56_034165 [Juglans regia]KAF5445088.1 hypothetical protein F2P56_034166 [Juglans regia]